MLKESYADLERLYAEDIGWRKIGDERSQLHPATAATHRAGRRRDWPPATR
jgi:hypothetical protein